MQERKTNCSPLLIVFAPNTLRQPFAVFVRPEHSKPFKDVERGNLQVLDRRRGEEIEGGLFPPERGVRGHRGVVCAGETDVGLKGGRVKAEKGAGVRLAQGHIISHADRAVPKYDPRGVALRRLVRHCTLHHHRRKN